MSVGCTCARRTVPNEDAGGRSSPPGAPSSLPPSPHHLPIPSLHVLAALSTFSPPCSPLLLPSRTLTRTINHPREVPFSSPISYLLALERRHGRESSLVTVDVANVIQHSKQRGCCACERARARVCFFFSFLFLVGSGGNGGGGGWEGRYETRVFMSPSLPVICDWPPAQFHLYERPCNCDRNSSNEVSMEEQFVVLSVRAEFGSYWCQDISG